MEMKNNGYKICRLKKVYCKYCNVRTGNCSNKRKENCVAKERLFRIMYPTLARK